MVWMMSGRHGWTGRVVRREDGRLTAGRVWRVDDPAPSHGCAVGTHWGAGVGRSGCHAHCPGGDPATGGRGSVRRSTEKKESKL